jgi:hypothetical protein
MRHFAVIVAFIGAVTITNTAAQASPPAPVVTSKQWIGVLNDWLDNARIDSRHSCGAVVVADAQLRAQHSPADPLYQRAIPALGRYARKVCPRHPQLAKVVVGMTNAEVANTAGMPNRPTLRCWLYSPTRGKNGLRVCFNHARVSLVQGSVHG